MISSPIYGSFRIYLPKDFLSPEVRKKFQGFYDMASLPYNDMIDFLNHSISNARLPGIRDSGSPKQTEAVTQRSRTYSSSMPSKDGQTKEFSVTFKLKGNYLNWIMLRAQMEYYLDNKDAKPFLPNIHLQIFDENDNIIMTMIHKNIQMREISDINFNKKNSGIGAKEFDVKFAYNDWEMKFYTDGQSNRNDDNHTYNSLKE